MFFFVYFSHNNNTSVIVIFFKCNFFRYVKFILIIQLFAVLILLQNLYKNDAKNNRVVSIIHFLYLQTHVRLGYLQSLIRCLEEAKYIENTLLVFSHGFYSDEINNVVQKIQFARVLQIFFPYGLQTHPNMFPGFSPNDCPHGISKKE